MKKALYALLMLVMVGCSNSTYEEVAREGYGISVRDGRFLAKEGSETSYYKYNDEDSRVYLLLEKDEKSGEVSPFLNLEYRGEDWIYMEKAIFYREDGKVEVDFLKAKFTDALVQEIPRASGNVVERILIPVTGEKVGELGNLFEKSGEVSVFYSSRYKNRNSKITLTPQEEKGIMTMIKLYNKVKGENINGN